jgi:methionyl-tRNA synthetase
MPETPHKFFLTTPIYYVNARPHIGHAYTTIAADVIARRHRLLGDDTFFLTGTDEHGQKVQRSAEKAGIPPQQFTDEVSGSFRSLWKRLGILDDSLSKNDPLLHRDFIRTTEERHKRGVQHLWRELEARGAIYLSSYTGAYCVSDEAFVDLPAGTPCPDCGRPLETVTEENYFFRLSDYQLPLLDLIESGQLHVQPETTRNEVLSFVRGNVAAVVTEVYDRIWTDPEDLTSRPVAAASQSEPLKIAEREGRINKAASGQYYVPGALKDLSISRTTFDWGIPVPGNPKHVVYVWLDALANYMTAVGYGSDDPAEQAKFARYWPADLHLVGKEITRFHCLYWPAFLLALNPKLQHKPNEPMPQITLAEHAAWAKDWLPKSIVANGWLLFEESKMSKSRGNVVRTETILDAFGPLCPPIPINTPQTAHQPKPDTALLKGTASAVPQTAPLEVAALAAEVTSAAPGLSGGSRGLQPPESTSHAEGALAPGLTPPTKAQQDLFAADILRYFLLREIPFGQDGTFSFDALITRYNADLANGYGNLVSRTLTMIDKYFGGTIHKPSDTSAFLDEDSTSNVMSETVKGSLASYDFARYIGAISALIASVDRGITLDAPWKLAADPTKQDKLAEILYNAAESIRMITVFLYPVMPYATASVWRQLGLGDIEEAARNGELWPLQWGGLRPGTKLGPLAPIFPRADKGLAQIMTEMENPATPATPEPTPTPTPEKSVASVSSGLSLSPDEPTKPEATPTITIDDFAKVDLRVAQIVVAERIPKADKLLRLEVDLGPNFPRRQILAGIAEYYTPEALIGRKVVIVANLAPRKMRGLESQGMIVAASIGPAGAPVLAGFLEDVELGARLK